MTEFFDFYGGPLSNFSGNPFTITHPWAESTSVGVLEPFTYKTVEHYYQAMKATTREMHDWIASALDPWETKRRGNKTQLRADWEDVKYAVMLLGLREKYKDPEYCEELLATGDATIREDSPTDFVWGYRNGGKNLLGLALMQIRSELDTDSPWGEECTACGWCDKPGACVWSIQCPKCSMPPKTKCVRVGGGPVGLHQERWDAVE